MRAGRVPGGGFAYMPALDSASAKEVAAPLTLSSSPFRVTWVARLPAEGHLRTLFPGEQPVPAKAHLAPTSNSATTSGGPRHHSGRLRNSHSPSGALCSRVSPLQGLTSPTWRCQYKMPSLRLSPPFHTGQGFKAEFAGVFHQRRSPDHLNQNHSKGLFQSSDPWSSPIIKIPLHFQPPPLGLATLGPLAISNACSGWRKHATLTFFQPAQLATVERVVSQTPRYTYLDAKLYFLRVEDQDKTKFTKKTSKPSLETIKGLCGSILPDAQREALQGHPSGVPSVFLKFFVTPNPTTFFYNVPSWSQPCHLDPHGPILYYLTYQCVRYLTVTTISPGGGPFSGPPSL